jgi:ureidoglycolate lyase
VPLGLVPFCERCDAERGNAAGPLSTGLTNARQGCNHARGVWHDRLIVPGSLGFFAVVDRIGPGTNLDECPLADRVRVRLSG